MTFIRERCESERYNEITSACIKLCQKSHYIQCTVHNCVFFVFFNFIFMAARQLAGRRPYILLLTFLSSYLLPFFRRLISEVSGPIVTKLCRMFGGDCNFLNWVKNLGVRPPKNLGAQNIKISDFAFDRQYLRTGTRYRRSENGVENCNHSLRACQIWGTLVHKRRKIVLSFRPTQSTFSDAHISSYLRG